MKVRRNSWGHLVSLNIPTTALHADLNLSLQRVIAPSELKTSDGEDRINTCTSVCVRARARIQDQFVCTVWLHIISICFLHCQIN